ncbi:MAG: UDP-2,3-diacylglucosamine diphosphatase LpxI [Sneathiella sp.]
MERPNVVSANHHSPRGMRTGIIAGKGNLPLDLAIDLKEQGQDPFLILVEGEADPADYTNLPHEIIPITKVGRFLKALKREACTQVTLVGPVSRPDFKHIFPDIEGLKLLGRIGASASKGDDGLLRTITTYIEEKGFKIVGAHKLTGRMTSFSGILGVHAPSDEDFKDINKGVAVIQAIGQFDIGQAVIVRNEYVLGVEAAEGTENLIRRCAGFKRDYPEGVLIKLSKPDQDLRADMPTIGPDTIDQAAETNLKGIAIQSEATLIVDKEEVVKRADRAGLFLFGVSVETTSGGA